MPCEWYCHLTCFLYNQDSFYYKYIHLTVPKLYSGDKTLYFFTHEQPRQKEHDNKCKWIFLHWSVWNFKETTEKMTQFWPWMPHIIRCLLIRFAWLCDGPEVKRLTKVTNCIDAKITKFQVKLSDSHLCIIHILDHIMALSSADIHINLLELNLLT